MSQGRDGPLIGADRIRELLVELGTRLDARGIEARMFLVRGAAMALAFSRDRVTRDLDAVFEPKQQIYEEASRMAAEHGLPATWLNDGVKGLLPDVHPPVEGVGTFTTRGLHVGLASAEYLFAMKAAAARQETDGEDLRRLADLLHLTSLDDALALVERFYARERLGPKTQLLLGDILAR